MLCFHRLRISWITQKVLDRFPWNIVEGSGPSPMEGHITSRWHAHHYPGHTLTVSLWTDRCRRSHRPVQQRRCGSIPVCSVGSSGPWCCVCSWRTWRCSGSRCSCSGWSGRSTHSLKQERRIQTLFFREDSSTFLC